MTIPPLSPCAQYHPCSPFRTLRGGAFGSGFGSALATLDANGELLGGRHAAAAEVEENTWRGDDEGTAVIMKWKLMVMLLLQVTIADTIDDTIDTTVDDTIDDPIDDTIDTTIAATAGDGLDDLLVSAPFASSGGRGGAVFLYINIRGRLR